MKLLFINFIKTLFCKHKFILKSTGRFRNDPNLLIDVYFFECKKCNKQKEIITYPIIKP